MNKKQISTAELDDIARSGLESIRECFSEAPPEGAEKKAKLCLTIIGKATSRMSAENNRLNTALRVAKTFGITPEDQRKVWDDLTGNEQKQIPAESQESSGAARETEGIS